jgi:hypothetical protein
MGMVPKFTIYTGAKLPATVCNGKNGGKSGQNPCGTGVLRQSPFNLLHIEAGKNRIFYFLFSFIDFNV